MAHLRTRNMDASVGSPFLWVFHTRTPRNLPEVQTLSLRSSSALAFPAEPDVVWSSWTTATTRDRQHRSRGGVPVGGGEDTRRDDPFRPFGRFVFLVVSPCSPLSLFLMFIYLITRIIRSVTKFDTMKTVGKAEQFEVRQSRFYIPAMHPTRRCRRSLRLRPISSVGSCTGPC